MSDSFNLDAMYQQAADQHSVLQAERQQIDQSMTELRARRGAIDEEMRGIERLLGSKTPRTRKVKAEESKAPAKPNGRTSKAMTAPEATAPEGEG